MNNKTKLEVGDIVRVFDLDEVEAFVEAGGEDYGLINIESYNQTTAFGKIRKVANVYEDGDICLEREDRENNYCYPFQICELVEEGE